MPNRLAHETSPYLRQHADNPVDWWPWCDEALASARAQNKPILLSIGYAACHWCHVMAHESFEDPAVARVMNAGYVNIKVDREERPDLDKVYQLAHQALARRGGGWPLTMFLTPDDLLPFFAGTYFPNAPRHNMPAFVQVLEGVRAWFDNKPEEVRAQNTALMRFLDEHGSGASHAERIDDTPIRNALERIAEQFDAANGGRRGGPKFPHASEIELLLDAKTESSTAMVATTLRCIASRGLRDHLAGGFFRYCVDAQWNIPHFEKMLYDNAQLLPLLARAATSLHDDMLAESAQACADWLISEMSAPAGGFWSSLDADSEGEEGRYYVWRRDDVRALLGDEEFAVVERRFGLDQPPNFEDHAWHLRETAPSQDVARALGIAPDEAENRWRRARAILLDRRNQRVRPALDDKILTAWNAMTIAGAARAMRAQPTLSELRDPAEQALDFLHTHLWKDARLYASHARDQTRFPAYLDDHAFLLDALLAMLQLRWNRRDLDWAIALADALLHRFEDREHGGFFFTAHDAETLPQRPKPFMDEALPSGNGVATRVLLKLGHLLGETRYLDAAERTLRAAWTTLSEYPHACCTLLLALKEFLDPPMHVVVRADDNETVRWNDALTKLIRTHPDSDVYRIPPVDMPLPGILDAQAHVRGGLGYVCRGTHCLPPIDEPAALNRV